MARILLIDDDPATRALLEPNLVEAAHLLTVAVEPERGLAIAAEQRPDLVVIDASSPGASGAEICKSIRKDPALRETLVMILSARADEIDRVVALEVGADDYVVKPFSLREVMLRVEALLRRARGQDGPTDEFGVLAIDRKGHRVWVRQMPVDLSALEFKLLLALYDQRDKVQTRRRLLTAVWGFDVAMTTRNVDSHIKRLRDKLGAAGAYVQTVRAFGYRFADRPKRPGGAGRTPRTEQGE